MSWASDPPPSYSSIFPGHHQLLTNYTVGQHQTTPLVHARQLAGHLKLLHAFEILRRDVESGDVSRFPPDVRALDAGARWGFFVNLAVQRFERWLNCIREVQSDAQDIEITLPPIDVVMVWHTYLLNPVWYAEDILRVSTLASLWIYTEYLTAYLGSPEILVTNTPCPERVNFWKDRTKTDYDPFDIEPKMERRLKCPHCEASTKASFLAPDAKGYAQSKFEAVCSTCGKTITKELLYLYKFAKDLVSEEPTAWLAGTLHSRDNKNDTIRASRIKKRVRSIIKAYHNQAWTAVRTVQAREVMTEWNYDPSTFSKKLRSILLPQIANRILQAYSDDKPFSIELVGAVLRQGSFVQKMSDLGWTHPAFLPDNEGFRTLKHCVARYHAFLNLIASSPGTFFVPTLDIDLAWHTHQLMASRYQTDCKALLGRYVDHEDKVEECHLVTSFDLTCRAWTDKYKVPYAYGGCPQPGMTLGQRVRRVFAREKDKVAETTPELHETPTPGAHASDHNAVQWTSVIA